MAIRQQDSEAEKPAAPQQTASPATATGVSRRRFTKAGLGASGVILTLASQPGMAQCVCTTPSGSLSGGLQSHHGPAPVCSGRSPGYWKNHFPGQLQSFTGPATFGSVFYCDKNHANFGNTTLEAMLTHQKFDANNVGMHLVAAYLNVQHGKTSTLTVPVLQGMWSEFQAKGYFHPTATVKWYGYDIVLYLSGTMS